MIRINLLRPQPKPLTDGEKVYLDAMLLNAYRMGIAQGESNMAARVLHNLNDLDHRSAERRTADRRNSGK